MTEFKIVSKKTSELIPYARNSRTHSETQIKQIASSINEWGFTMPILVDEKNTILAGHGRLMAAQLLKMEEVPTIEATGWSEVQKKAYVIADNKIAMNSGWDYEALKLEFEEISDSDLDISLTGFDEMDLEAILDDADFVEPEILDLEAKKDTYDNAEVKRIMLMFSTEDFEEVERLSEGLRYEVGVDDNSQLFKFLIENYITTNRIDEGNDEDS
tara:strand:- start:738 stop:1382 length:645 start_codon:yes stop_codon:yes gene_type:complete